MYSDISYIIHYRKDSIKRYQNLKAIHSFYKNIAPDIEFIIIEDDIIPKLDTSFLNNKDQYFFYKNDSIYKRTYCFNYGSKLSNKKYIIAGDTDVFINPEYILKSCNIMEKHNLALIYPYNGLFVVVKSNLRNEFINSPKYNIVEQFEHTLIPTINYENEYFLVGHTNSQGGINMFNHEMFNQFKGYNPLFLGWGFEDNEILNRLTRLGYNAGRYNKPKAIAWHLEHYDPNGDQKDKSNPFYFDNMKLAKRLDNASKNDFIELMKKWEL